MELKRITLFLGHYGSGKTFNAVNYALNVKKQGKKVSIYDLDIVNPYFRTIDAKKMLNENGIELVVSPFAQTNVDIPAMNSASYKMISDKSKCAIVDIGGDDRGALALGRFVDKIKEENDYDCLLVVNKFRPETRDIDSVKEVVNEIQNASKLNFTGIVNNSNLGKETSVENVLSGYEFCQKLSNELNIPVKYTSVRRDLITQEIKEKIKNILPITPIEYGSWV